MPIFKLCWTKREEDITTITTPISLCRFKRLVPGLKSSSSIFQVAMEDVLGDLDKLIIYQDDVLIGTGNDEEIKMVID